MISYLKKLFDKLFKKVRQPNLTELELLLLEKPVLKAFVNIYNIRLCGTQQTAIRSICYSGDVDIFYNSGNIVVFEDYKGNLYTYNEFTEIEIKTMY